MALNWYLLRQGGLVRRPGTIKVRETKYDYLDTVLIPFEFSVDDAFILEFGHGYIRFYKNDFPVFASPGVPYEIGSPYLVENLRTLHYTQSADVMFIFHPLYQQRRLSRISDTNWTFNPVNYRPPPSFEADTDISADLPPPSGPPTPPVDVPAPGEPYPPGGAPSPPGNDSPGGGAGGDPGDGPPGGDGPTGDGPSDGGGGPTGGEGP